jgi:hypothetical protein
LIFFVCVARVSAETRVVKTYSLVNGAGMRIMRYQHVFARHHSQEGRPTNRFVRLTLKAMQRQRPRQWGACWLALTLWQTLDLDVFWAERLPPSRKGTRWDLVLFVLADPHVLYGCHDRLLAHKEALFTHLTGCWRDLFNVSFEVLLYDLTSTYNGDTGEVRVLADSE